MNYINLTRPANALLSVLGVILGYWFSNNSFTVFNLSLLLCGTFFTLSFGNVINDIKDIKGDRLNHPNRALASAKISVKNAYIFAIILFILSLLCGFSVSKLHFFAILIPLFLLIAYTLFLKSVPLIGNIVISILVSYTLFFGALGDGNFKIILIPALLAFILNFEREIIKDIQDTNGDLKTGVKTTAVLPKIIIRITFLILSFSYLALLPFPYIYGYFDKFYLFTALLLILPVHIIISSLLLGVVKRVTPHQISNLIKIEMMLGLILLAIDKYIQQIVS